MITKFDDLALQNFANVLACILTHSKITDMLALCNIPQAEGSNKSDRIYYAFKNIQKRSGCGNNVIDFIQKTITPKRYDDNKQFELERAAINEKLLYEGYEINEKGEIQKCKKLRKIRVKLHLKSMVYLLYD